MSPWCLHDNGRFDGPEVRRRVGSGVLQPPLIHPWCSRGGKTGDKHVAAVALFLTDVQHALTLWAATLPRFHIVGRGDDFGRGLFVPQAIESDCIGLSDSTLRVHPGERVADFVADWAAFVGGATDQWLRLFRSHELRTFCLRKLQNW